jgi:HEPN domain-containing protein
MIDISRQIGHWRKGAKEDLEVAKDLVVQRRIRHGLFFAHLALEKILKAHVCRTSQDIAPPVHNLLRLADLAAIRPDPEMRTFLAEVSPFNIEARYPDLLVPEPTFEEAKYAMEKIEEVFAWLNQKFDA